MGVRGKDIKGVKNLNKTLRTWEDLKIWSKETRTQQEDIFRKSDYIGLFWSSPIPRNLCVGHKKKRPLGLLK